MIGNGDGHWDVPVGGMGALTDALARAALGGRRGDPLRRRGDRDRPRRRGAAGTAARRGAGHVLANVAPAVLARLLGEPRARARARGRAAQAQHAARAPAAAARRRPSTRARRSPARSTSTRPRRSSRPPTSRPRRRAPALPPCEIYCHSLTDPTILGPELRAAGAQTLTCFGAAHARAAVRATTRAPRQRAVEATLRSLDSVLAEPIEDCLWRTPDGEPCLEARTPPELEAELGLPGGNIFHRDLSWPFAEARRRGGRLGRRDRPPARAAVRRGRAPRRRRQRDPRPQRRDGRPHAAEAAASGLTASGVAPSASVSTTRAAHARAAGAR